jgi:AcrR family transcriptional regulator
VDRTDVASDRATARAKIIEAAAQLLHDGGARAVTTRAVAERAGLQPPTIYRLFGDKEGLIRAVAEAATETYSNAKAAADDHLDPVDALRVAWRRHIDFGLANPELYVLLGGYSHPEPSPATAAGIQVLRRHVTRMASAGLLVVSEQRAVEMIHATGNGTVLALIGQPAADRDLGLAEAVFDAVIAAISSHHAPGNSTQHDTLTALVRIGAVIDELAPLTDNERRLLSEWIRRCITAFEASAAT